MFFDSPIKLNEEDKPCNVPYRQFRVDVTGDVAAPGVGWGVTNDPRHHSDVIQSIHVKL